MKRFVLGLVLAVLTAATVRADIYENKLHDGEVTPSKIGAKVRNDTSGTLTAGTLVYVCGWKEETKREKVCKADADASGAAAKYILRDTIADANEGTGYSTYRLTGQDTSLGAVGDPVYLSATAGGWTLTAPSATNAIKQVVGRVSVVSATVGAIDFDLRGNNIVSIGTNEIQAGVAISSAAARTQSVADSGNGSAATFTITAVPGVVLVTCNDADGCASTLSETSAVSGGMLTIINVGTNAVTVSDSAGVSETTGTITLGANDSVQLVYATSAWVEVSASNN